MLLTCGIRHVSYILPRSNFIHKKLSQRTRDMENLRVIWISLIFKRSNSKIEKKMVKTDSPTKVDFPYLVV